MLNALFPEHSWTGFAVLHFPISQAARNLTNEEHRLLNENPFLIHERNAKHSDELLRGLCFADVGPAQRPARAPECNALVERFV